MQDPTVIRFTTDVQTGAYVHYSLLTKQRLHFSKTKRIDLHLTMGNHDRRSSFLKCWPEYGQNALVPGRFTQVVSFGFADLVLLDTLKGTDDRAENDMGPVEGTIDPAQLAWFEMFVAEAKRPFLVGSHQFRDLYIRVAC